MTNETNLWRTTLKRNSSLEVRRSSIHGWGVFSTDDIPQYEILEEAPFIVVPQGELDASPVCERYSYGYDDANSIIGFGLAGLYNHKSKPNSAYEIDNVNGVIRHYTTKDIKAGDELTLDYGIENVNFYNLEG